MEDRRITQHGRAGERVPLFLDPSSAAPMQNTCRGKMATAHASTTVRFRPCQSGLAHFQKPSAFLVPDPV